MSGKFVGISPRKLRGLKCDWAWGLIRPKLWNPNLLGWLALIRQVLTSRAVKAAIIFLESTVSLRSTLKLVSCQFL